MKIRYIGMQKAETNIESSQINIGTVFSGKISGVTSVFLKAYSGIVDLKNPSTTWSSGGMFVCDYRELDVELVVNN